MKEAAQIHRARVRGSGGAKPRILTSESMVYPLQYTSLLNCGFVAASQKKKSTLEVGRRLNHGDLRTDPHESRKAWQVETAHWSRTIELRRAETGRLLELTGQTASPIREFSVQ